MDGRSSDTGSSAVDLSPSSSSQVPPLTQLCVLCFGRLHYVCDLYHEYILSVCIGMGMVPTVIDVYGAMIWCA